MAIREGTSRNLARDGIGIMLKASFPRGVSFVKELSFIDDGYVLAFFQVRNE